MAAMVKRRGFDSPCPRGDVSPRVDGHRRASLFSWVVADVDRCTTIAVSTAAAHLHVPNISYWVCGWRSSPACYETRASRTWQMVSAVTLKNGPGSDRLRL